ncbi:MAG TPA: MFS transporter [Flavisolibacter sp.]|jgi:MFS family permease|nr:MFS transporter [Flavisolibacter sp.]
MALQERSLKARRVRISLFFFFYGFIFATWASRIPNIQVALNLTETELGAILLVMPVGSFLTLPFSGYVTSRIGSRKVVIAASLIYAVLLTGIGYAAATWQLALCLFLFGSAGNMMNIAVNTQALALEKLYQRTIISSFHGMWSIAGLAAAFLGTWFMGRAFPVSYHFLLVASIAFISFLICSVYLLEEELKPQEKRPFFTRPDRAFWGLGMIAFCSMICQGAMFDWSGVYFRKVVFAQPAYIGIGYTAFMISMTFIRFITDWLTQHFGFRRIIVCCGLATTLGLIMAVVFPKLIPATIGLLLVGMGVSPGVPLVFSAASKTKLLPPPVAIAAVSSIGMIGLLIGPPIIGFIAGVTSLRTSFLILSLFGLAIIGAAMRLQPQEN